MPEVVEQTDRTGYDADIERAAALGGPDWIAAIREHGAARFAELQFPTHRDEVWRSTNIKPIVKTTYRSLIAERAGAVSAEAVSPHILDESYPRLVFVDGQYDAELSSIDTLPAGVTVSSISDAIAADNPQLREHLNAHVPVTNAFVALNGAMLHDGVFVAFEANAKVDVPVHAIYISTGADVTASYPRNLVIAGDGSECAVIETYAGIDGGNAYVVNAVAELLVGANAHLSRTKIVQDDAQGSHLETAQIVQGRDSRYTAFTMTMTGHINRNELRVKLDGENAECSLNGLYLNDGDRVIDNALNVEHVASNCRSRMAYKGILADNSDAVFTGKVFVHQSAQKTDSDQLNQNLLLSDNASIDTRPQLEIFADDVKCTHGATIGGFPNELIFYFRSRGIEPVRAHGILTCGFADEIIDEITVEPLQERLHDYIMDKYKAL